MNLLDISILIVIVLTTIRGIFKGIIQEAATIVGIFASFFLASFYYKTLALWLTGFFPNHKIMLEILCFVSIFVLGMFLVHLLAMMTRGAIRLVLLGWLDRVLGGVFGLIKGAVIIFFLVTILMLFYPQSSPIVKGSRFFPSILTLTEKITFMIPSKIKEDFLHKKKELQDIWSGKKRTYRKTGKPTPDE
jgi:membrane protein required for colicin V production